MGRGGGGGGWLVEGGMSATEVLIKDVTDSYIPY